MTTSVKVYHSELSNAPVLSGTAGALVAILDACLVNGWGSVTATSVIVAGGVATATFSGGHVFEPGRIALIAGATPGGLNGEQRVSATTTNSISWLTTVADGTATGTITAKLAPAGWEKMGSGNVAAYRSASMDSSRCWARIDDSSATQARLRGYETMTDVNTGVGPIPTDLQISGGLYVLKSEAASGASRRWIVVADDRTVYVLTGYYSSWPWDYDPVMFGDCRSAKSGDAYSFCVAGNTSSANSQYVGAASALVNSSTTTGYYIARSYTQVGGSVSALVTKPGLWALSGAPSNPPFPNPVNNGMDICPTLIYEGYGSTAARRGDLPGMWGIPHSLGTNLDSKSEISGIEGLPGRSLLFVRYQSASNSNGYRYALDITGPWR